MTTPIPPPAEILDLLPDAVCIVDAEGHLLFVNAAFERILGYAAIEVLGRRTFGFVHPDDLAATLAQVEHIMAGQLQRHFRNRYLHRQGHWVDMQWSARWHPQHGVRIAVGREVTELRRAECELEYLARHDHLTGLPNRHHILHEIDRAIELARTHDTQLALLYIDLDGFKAVNDRCGHEVGDDLLREVATRLKSSCRAGDTPARLGGDEFIILMPGCVDVEAGRNFAAFVRSQLNQPYPLPSGTVFLDASVGVAVFPHDASDRISLMVHADRDMYAIKAARAT